MSSETFAVRAFEKSSSAGSMISRCNSARVLSSVMWIKARSMQSLVPSRILSQDSSITFFHGSDCWKNKSPTIRGLKSARQFAASAPPHTVLGHLEDPVAAIREMLRVVKKGGIVALRESDLRMWSVWPEYPEMKVFNEMLCKVSASNGAFINAGARLVSWALEAEPRLEREQITASAGTWCYSSPEERKLWGETLADRCVNGNAPKKAVESGICTREDQQRMAEAWLKWMNAKDGWFGCMHGEVVIRLEISR
jgi:SAM-dependent methyltransferase